MLCILRDDIPIWTGRHKREYVVEEIASMEHDKSLQRRKEGWFSREMETLTWEDPETKVVHSQDYAVGPRTFVEIGDTFISPLCGDLTLADFPDNSRFGNGSTGPITITYSRDGVEKQVVVVAVVFPRGTVLSEAKRQRLCEIYEGIPPGTPSYRGD